MTLPTWGMIIAFTSLGAADGQAGPADLSLGISKALFHTLLGLVLAIPCLLTFGIYRGIVDRICTRAMVESARPARISMMLRTISATAATEPTISTMVNTSKDWHPPAAARW